MPLLYCSVIAFTEIIREAPGLNIRRAAFLVRASSGISQSLRDMFEKLTLNRSLPLPSKYLPFNVPYNHPSVWYCHKIWSWKTTKKLLS